jgi:chemotaxis protein MotA
MLTIVGIVVVIVCVIGGFTMAGGNVIVLMQPAEFMVIGGAALGSILVSTPTKIVKQMIASITGTMKGSKLTRETYMGLLKLLNALFQTARRDGIIALEPLFMNLNAEVYISPVMTADDVKKGLSAIEKEFKR